MANDDLFKRESLSVINFYILPGWLGVWLYRYLTRRGSLRTDPKVVVDNLYFSECPRFRSTENALYFSDIFGKKVIKFDLESQSSKVVVESDDYTGGIGWLPDGTMLVAGADKLQLLSVKPGETEAKPRLYANLENCTKYRVNDLVVSSDGQAYVGNYGFNFHSSYSPISTTLVKVGTDQNVTVESTRMLFPNGSVITPDGKTLLVAETFRASIAAFDINADGSLTNRREWANIGLPPDGITLDAEGCVWAAIPQVGGYLTAGGIVRVQEGGKILSYYGFGDKGMIGHVVACQLATDKSTGKHLLFFCECKNVPKETIFAMEKPTSNAVVKVMEVEVGPATMEGNPNYSGGYC